MGKYQAVRIAQSAIPLDAIDLKRRVIHYPGRLMKGGRSYDQAIDPDFLPVLTKLVAHRRELGCPTLCEFPKLPSLAIRRFLDLHPARLRFCQTQSSWFEGNLGNSCRPERSPYNVRHEFRESRQCRGA